MAVLQCGPGSRECCQRFVIIDNTAIYIYFSNRHNILKIVNLVRFVIAVRHWIFMKFVYFCMKFRCFVWNLFVLYDIYLFCFKYIGYVKNVFFLLVCFVWNVFVLYSLWTSGNFIYVNSHLRRTTFSWWRNSFYNMSEFHIERTTLR